MDNSGPAFPHLRAECQTSHETEMYEGVSKRELAAMFAMAGFLANQPYMGSWQREAVASEAVAQADALLAALKEEPK